MFGGTWASWALPGLDVVGGVPTQAAGKVRLEVPIHTHQTTSTREPLAEHNQFVFLRKKRPLKKPPKTSRM